MLTKFIHSNTHFEWDHNTMLSLLNDNINNMYFTWRDWMEWTVSRVKWDLQEWSEIRGPRVFREFPDQRYNLLDYVRFVLNIYSLNRWPIFENFLSPPFKKFCQKTMRIHTLVESVKYEFIKTNKNKKGSQKINHISLPFINSIDSYQIMTFL